MFAGREMHYVINKLDKKLSRIDQVPRTFIIMHASRAVFVEGLAGVPHASFQGPARKGS